MDLLLQRIEPFHQKPVLVPGQLGSFLRIAGPCKGAAFDPLVEQKEAGSLPEKSLDPVSSFSTEQEEDILFKRIEVVFRSNDLRQTINAFAEIRVTAGDDDPFDPGRFSQHSLLPG